MVLKIKTVKFNFFLLKFTIPCHINPQHKQQKKIDRQKSEAIPHIITNIHTLCGNYSAMLKRTPIWTNDLLSTSLDNLIVSQPQVRFDLINSN